jgi:hypothetical protein
MSWAGGNQASSSVIKGRPKLTAAQKTHGTGFYASLSLTRAALFHIDCPLGADRAEPECTAVGVRLQ